MWNIKYSYKKYTCIGTAFGRQIMKVFEGQCISELALIIIFISVVLVATVGLLGDSITNVFFQAEKLSSIFNNSRASMNIDKQNKLMNTKFNLNGKEYSSPLEAHVSSKLTSGKLIETNGAAGNIREYVELFQAYISEFNDIIENESTSNKSNIDSILADYTKAIDDYVAKDNMLVQNNDESLLNNINNLDITLDFHKGGKLASSLKEEIDLLLVDYPDGPNKSLIKAYSKDILSFGEHINYIVDSRLISQNDKILDEYYNNLALVNNKAILNSKYKELQSATDDIVKKHNGDLYGMCPNMEFDNTCFMELYKSYFETTKSCEKSTSFGNCMPSLDDMSLYSGERIDWDNRTDRYFIKESASMVLSNKSVLSFYEMEDWYREESGHVGEIWIDTNGASDGANTIGKDVFGFGLLADGSLEPMGSTAYYDFNDCNATGEGYSCTNTMIDPNYDPSEDFTTLQSLYDQLVKIQADKTISDEYKADFAKKIDVFREGTYADIFPGTFNSEVLCKGIGASIADNKCSLK